MPFVWMTVLLDDGLMELIVFMPFSWTCVTHGCLSLSPHHPSSSIKQTLHFEYISDAVSSGLMSVQLQTSCPVVYGVLNCLDDAQVTARSTGDNNHGYDWGKTAVEMALLRNEALNMKGVGGSKSSLQSLGFGKVTPVGGGKEAPAKETSKPGFF